MDKKNLDELLKVLDIKDQLLKTLAIIALYKAMLPFPLRGWVNALGLHVQERKTGRWSRLQAGGSFRSYLDAWREEDGDWQVKKFDKETWEQRFAPVLDATYNIADYLFENAAQTGGFDSEKSANLIEAIEHFKFRQEWLWLPGVSLDLEEISRQMAQFERGKLNGVISYAERHRKDSKYAGDWQFLAMLYDLAARYKDMEQAIQTAYNLIRSEEKSSAGFFWRWRRTVGMLYFAAFSNSTLGQDVVVLGSIPSKVTAESLGYTVEEVRTLAVESLEAALGDAKRENSETGALEVQKIEAAIAACSTH